MPANDILFPESVQNIFVLFDSFFEKILKDDRKKIEESLVNIEGMIDIKQKSKQIEDQLQNVVSNKEGMKLLVRKIEKLHNVLSKMLATCDGINSVL